MRPLGVRRSRYGARPNARLVQKMTVFDSWISILSSKQLHKTRFTNPHKTLPNSITQTHTRRRPLSGTGAASSVRVNVNPRDNAKFTGTRESYFNWLYVHTFDSSRIPRLKSVCAPNERFVMRICAPLGKLCCVRRVFRLQQLQYGTLALARVHSRRVLRELKCLFIVNDLFSPRLAARQTRHTIAITHSQASGSAVQTRNVCSLHIKGARMPCKVKYTPLAFRMFTHCIIRTERQRVCGLLLEKLSLSTHFGGVELCANGLIGIWKVVGVIAPIAYIVMSNLHWEKYAFQYVIGVKLEIDKGWVD